MANDSETRFEALKVLYDGQQGAVKVLAERSFSTTLQAIGFDVAVVAAIIVGGVRLSDGQKVLAIVFIVAFTAIVAKYLYSKAVAHDAEIKRLNEIEVQLGAIAGIGSRSARPFSQAFVRGSGLFMLLIILAGLGAVWWIATQS